MTSAEASSVLALAAVYDQRTVGEADVRGWADALGGVAVGDALEAVKAHYRARRDRVMPADVLVLARSARQDRAMRQLPPAVVPATFDAVGVPVGVGLAREALHDPVDAVQVRRRVRSVRCPMCRAKAGDPCTSIATGRPLDRHPAHPSRMETAGVDYQWSRA